VLGLQPRLARELAAQMRIEVGKQRALAVAFREQRLMKQAAAASELAARICAWAEQVEHITPAGPCPWRLSCRLGRVVDAVRGWIRGW